MKGINTCGNQKRKRIKQHIVSTRRYRHFNLNAQSKSRELRAPRGKNRYYTAVGDEWKAQNGYGFCISGAIFVLYKEEQ
jgi:hypothetical protein